MTNDVLAQFVYAPTLVKYAAVDGTEWWYHSDSQASFSLLRYDISVAPTPTVEPSGETLKLGWNWVPAPPITTVATPTATEPMSTDCVVTVDTKLAYPYIELAVATATAVVLRVLGRGLRWLRR